MLVLYSNNMSGLSNYPAIYVQSSLSVRAVPFQNITRFSFHTKKNINNVPFYQGGVLVLNTFYDFHPCLICDALYTMYTQQGTQTSATYTLHGSCARIAEIARVLQEVLTISAQLSNGFNRTST